jgi:hypothetical protein
LKPPDDQSNRKIVNLPHDGAAGDWGDATGTDDIGDIFKISEKWEDFSKNNPEDTRKSLGSIVFWTFSICVGAFALSGCGIAIFSGTPERVEALIKIIQATGAILTPVMGFVAGHYFASKSE